MRINSSILTATIFILFFAFSAFFSPVQAQNKGSEILVVEIIFSFNGPKDVSGVYISSPDGKSEKVPLIGFIGEENIQKNGLTIAQEIKKIYDAGWQLESACGGDNSKRYIFKK